MADPDREKLLEGALKDPSIGGNAIAMTRENTGELLDRFLAEGAK